MILTRLIAQNFARISSCDLAFNAGLNVVYGPNETGKSTLTDAVRAALLLPHTSSAAKRWIPWGTETAPSVELQLQVSQAEYWRIRKTFGKSGETTLESGDRHQWSFLASGRQVDEELRNMLRWGLPDPRKSRGLPDTFLTSVLLPSQNNVIGILKESLADDKEESGRQRLKEALRAMAQPPEFTRIFKRAEQKTEEAYSPKTGRIRSGKTSPFYDLANAVTDAQQHYEECRIAADSARFVEQELQQLMQQFEKTEQQLATATSKAQEADQRVRQINSIREQLKVANTDLEKHRQTHAQLESLRQEASKAAAQAQTAKQVTAEKRRQLQQAEQQHKQHAMADSNKDQAAEEAVRDLERQQKQLQHQNLQRQLEAIRKQKDRLLQFAELKKEQERRQQEIQKIEQESVQISQLKRWHLTTVVRDRLQQLQQLGRRQQRLDEISARLPNRIVTAQEIRLVEDRYRQKELALAANAVRFTVHIEPRSLLSGQAAIDGADSTPINLSGPVHLDATSELRVQLEDVADIHVETTETDTVAQARKAVRQWESEAVPILNGCECMTPADLRAQLDDAAQVKLLRNECESLKASLGLESSNAIQSAIAEAQTFISQANDEVTDFAPFGDTICEESSTVREKKIEDAARTIAEKSTQAEIQLAKIQERLEQLQTVIQSEESTCGIARDGLPSSDYLVLLAGRLPDLENRWQQTEKELQTLESRQVNSDAQQVELQATAERVKECQDQLKTAEETERQQQSLADQWLGKQQAQEEAVDAAAFTICEQTVERLTSQLQQNEQTSESEAVFENVQQLTVLRDEVRQRLNMKRGELKHAGGAIVQDRLKDAEQNLELARRRLERAQLDYEGWQLLRNSMQQAEQQSSHHLGQNLTSAMTQSIERITSGRYGRILLGPTMETDGIEFQGMAQAIDQLSLGTQEQFATMLRLILARHLQSVLVLDDQLTQSDPDRMRLLRNLLQESASEHQVIVFTCRPNDYLSSENCEDVHAIDLAAAIA